MKRVLVPSLLLALAIAMPLQAQAGRSCEQAKPTAALIVKGMQLAERTSQQLDASGARVVLLARAGQDLSKYGLRYSHLGIAYKTDEGPWRVVHKLNQCGTALLDMGAKCARAPRTLERCAIRL